MIAVGDVVRTEDGAIGSVVDWTDHGMKPGYFSIAWDESTVTNPVSGEWTAAEAESLTVIN